MGRRNETQGFNALIEDGGDLPGDRFKGVFLILIPVFPATDLVILTIQALQVAA
jgi:hypothetical protein